MAQQHGLHTGLRKFGEKGKQAVFKELEQIKAMDAYTPVEASSLTTKENTQAVESIMLLTKKEMVKLKDMLSEMAENREDTSGRRTWHHQQYY